MTRFPRSIATAVLISMLVGFLPPAAALGQTPPTAPASPPSARSEVEDDAMRASCQVDGYTVGAAALNVLWVPFKVAECGISRQGLERLSPEEGCVHKWLIEADDLRPALTSHP
jgi:hypothetical protein